MFSIVLRKVCRSDKFMRDFFRIAESDEFKRGFGLDLNALTEIESLFINVGGMLELAEAIRDYHDSTLFPSVVS